MRAFCSGAMRPNTLCSSTAAWNPASSRAASSAPEMWPPGRSIPSWRTSATTVSGLSPLMIFGSMPISSIWAKASATLVAQHVGDGDQGQRADVAQAGLGVGQRRRLREDEPPQAGPRRLLVAALEAAVVGVRQHRLGRAEHEVPPPAAQLQRQRAPAPLRVERHTRDGPGAVSVRRQSRRQGGACAALVGAGGGEGAQPAAVVRGPLAASGDPVGLAQAELVGGDRARLVEADDVEVVHRLDRVDVLHDRAPAGEPHRPHGEGDGHAQQQPLGHDGGDGGGGVLDRVGEVGAGDGGGDEQQRAQRRRRDEQDAHDALEADLQRRRPADEFAGVGRQPLRIGLAAHPLRDEAQAAGRAKAARQHGNRRGPCGPRATPRSAATHRSRPRRRRRARRPRPGRPGRSGRGRPRRRRWRGSATPRRRARPSRGGRRAPAGRAACASRGSPARCRRRCSPRR